VLNCWLRGPVCGSIRLQSRSVQILSDRLMRRVNIVHRESASETDRWNAVEFRQCLLYTAVHSHLKKRLKTLEHLVRKTEGSLSQVMRRLLELQKFCRQPVPFFASSCIPKFEHLRGPVTVIAQGDSFQSPSTKPCMFSAI
jgi:hypothetical protein